MIYLKTYCENNKNEIEYIGVKDTKSNNEKLKQLGYNVISSHNKKSIFNNYIWIYICHENTYSEIFYGEYDPETDLIININDIPKRKDLDKYVKYLEEGNKLGLL